MSDDNLTPEATSAAAPVATAEQTFSKEYVQQLRNEAARYRTEKNDAVEAAKAAVTADWEGKLAQEQSKAADLESKLGLADLTLTKVKTALSLGVPSDKVLAFAEILKGETEDEIKASAESAKELFGVAPVKAPATDPTQGSGNSHLALNGDPILDALKKAVGAK